MRKSETCEGSSLSCTGGSPPSVGTLNSLVRSIEALARYTAREPSGLSWAASTSPSISRTSGPLSLTVWVSWFDWGAAGTPSRQAKPNVKKHDMKDPFCQWRSNDRQATRPRSFVQDRRPWASPGDGSAVPTRLPIGHPDVMSQPSGPRPLEEPARTGDARL